MCFGWQWRGASRLQVLRLLKGDAISGRHGYQRWPPCSGIQRVAMQTLPAASVQFFTGGCAKPVKVKRWGVGGGWVGGQKQPEVEEGRLVDQLGEDLLLQMIYLSVWCTKNLALLQLGDIPVQNLYSWGRLLFQSCQKILQFLISTNRPVGSAHGAGLNTSSARRGYK